MVKNQEKSEKTCAHFLKNIVVPYFVRVCPHPPKSLRTGLHRTLVLSTSLLRVVANYLQRTSYTCLQHLGNLDCCSNLCSSDRKREHLATSSWLTCLWLQVAIHVLFHLYFASKSLFTFAVNVMVADVTPTSLTSFAYHFSEVLTQTSANITSLVQFQSLISSWHWKIIRAFFLLYQFPPLFINPLFASC